MKTKPLNKRRKRRKRRKKSVGMIAEEGRLGLL